MSTSKWDREHPDKLNEYRRAWRERNPGSHKPYYLANRERLLAKAKASYDPELNRTQKRQRYYGLNFHSYVVIRVSQDDACAICRVPFVKEPHVDHNHITGRIRGLLCADCNHGIGKFSDSPEVLLAAADYLRGNNV